MFFGFRAHAPGRTRSRRARRFSGKGLPVPFRHFRRQPRRTRVNAERERPGRPRFFLLLHATPTLTFSSSYSTTVARHTRRRRSPSCGGWLSRCPPQSVVKDKRRVSSNGVARSISQPLAIARARCAAAVVRRPAGEERGATFGPLCPAFPAASRSGRQAWSSRWLRDHSQASGKGINTTSSYAY